MFRWCNLSYFILNYFLIFRCIYDTFLYLIAYRVCDSRVIDDKVLCICHISLTWGFIAVQYKYSRSILYVCYADGPHESGPSSFPFIVINVLLKAVIKHSQLYLWSNVGL